jgi:AI-2 transport protein TqsA
MPLKFLTICAAIGTLTLLIYILVIGQAFLQPLIVAIALWYLIITLQQAIQGARRIGIRLPYGVAMLLAIAIVAGGIWLLVALINSNINSVIDMAPRYQARVELLIGQAFDLFNVPKEDRIESLLKRIDLPEIVKAAFRSLTALAGDLSMILLYTAFLLLEYRTFGRKLAAMSRTQTQETEVRGVFAAISQDIKTYVRIKTTLSVIVALLCFGVMKIVGLELAGFWAVLFFVMNFIPTIGAILGTLFPALMLMVQFDSPALIISMIVVLIAIPSIINNVVEPKLMGRSLNLSALVIILSLVFWGSIWGVLGMFLCVPIMVILNIVLAKFDGTRPIAVLLSADGRVDSVRDHKGQRTREPAPAPTKPA